MDVVGIGQISSPVSIPQWAGDHLLREGKSVTELSEGVSAHNCPSQHPLPAGSLFCPVCRQPMAPSTVAVAPTFSVQFTTGPRWLVGSPRFDALALAAASLAFLSATTLTFCYIDVQRLPYYAVIVTGLILLVQRTKRLGPWELLGLTGAAAVHLVTFSALVYPSLDGNVYHALGSWDGDQYWPDPYGAASMFGRVYLAVGLATLWNPRLRADIREFMRPRKRSSSIAVVALLTLMALLALLTLSHAFTGWVSFSIPSQAG